MAVTSAPSPVRDGVTKTPRADVAIEISGVSLRFDTRDGSVQALSNINLKVAPARGRRWPEGPDEGSC